MAPLFSGSTIKLEAGCREDPLPRPRLRRMRQLPFQRAGQRDVAGPGRRICEMLRFDLGEVFAERQP